MVNYRRVSYTNHLGSCFEFGESTGAYLTTDTDIFSYGREYNADVGAYSTTAPTSREIDLTVAFDGTHPESRQMLFDIADADAESGEPGTLRLGDWELSGIFVASELDPFYLGVGTGTRKLTFLTKNPVWQRHVVKTFDPKDTRAAIINESHTASPITLEVDGPADSVNVTIGGNTYEVDASIPEGGKLVIDGLAKTATVYDTSGASTNVLGTRRGEQVRGSGYYLFEPVPSGYHVLTWHPKNELKVTIHEQRMEVVIE